MVAPVSGVEAAESGPGVACRWSGWCWCRQRRWRRVQWPVPDF